MQTDINCLFEELHNLRIQVTTITHRLLAKKFTDPSSQATSLVPKPFYQRDYQYMPTLDDLGDLFEELTNLRIRETEVIGEIEEIIRVSQPVNQPINQVEPETQPTPRTTPSNYIRSYPDRDGRSLTVGDRVLFEATAITSAGTGTITGWTRSAQDPFAKIERDSTQGSRHNRRAEVKRKPGTCTKLPVRL